MALNDFSRIDQSTVVNLSDGAAEVIAHLCEGDCLTYGSVMSWCETRGDCVHVVTCPSCSIQFQLSDSDIAELESWTDKHGSALVCGVRDVA